MKRLTLTLLAMSLLMSFPLGAQEINWKTFDPKTASPEEIQRVIDYLDRHASEIMSKITGDAKEIRSLIIRGNKITTVVYNYGNITRPNTLSNVADLVWNRLGYGFEFTPLVAGEVVDTRGDTVHILDDGMWLANQGGYSPDNTVKWGWLPKAGYAAPGQADIAAWSHRKDNAGDLARRPHSWPESWYNPILGRYVWPAFLGNDATTPDEEVYFVVDDNTNAKYQYYPFPNDSLKRGLGLDLECRFFQFNNPLAEDIIFLVYRVTNRSPKTIDKVYFGMYGDPHVGGAGDYGDDRAFFIPPRGPLAEAYSQRARSMVFAWDDDGKGDANQPTGYFGFKFLESPTNSSNLIDDDDDGITDESPFNDAGIYIDGVTVPLSTGISDTAKYVTVYGPLKPRWSGDEDGDWDPAKNDVGLDGIPGTGDFGEGNGRPDIGYDNAGTLVSEPNFGIRDVSESDQIGLTSFWALPYTNTLPNVPKNDILFWQLLSSDSIAIDQELLRSPGDNVFVYGSGPFALAPGATQRFSIALLMGENFADLVLNSETAQRVLEANYLFAQPPPKPTVTAVPGDGRVTLFWNNVAELAIDPLTNTNDFEGYKIYRSEDYTFADVYTVTDANGVPFLGSPMTGADGKPAQFDLINQWSGLHPVEYLGRGVKYNLGSNTGLVHEYVDSTVTNGKTYYYAVASYDHGFDTLGVNLPPTESQIAITRDPITNDLQFDVNTVNVTPGPLPSGTVRAVAGENYKATRRQGIATGSVGIKVFEEYAVPNNGRYDILFRTGTTGGVTYDITAANPVSEQFESRDTIYVPFTKRNLIPGTVTVKNASGAVVDPSNYLLDFTGGRIRGVSTGSLPAGTYTASYQYYPVYGSRLLSSEDSNPVFDGMRVYVQDEPLGIDSARSAWATVNNTSLRVRVQKPVSLPSTFPFRPAPIDIDMVWGRTDTLANGKWAYPSDTLLNSAGRRLVPVPFKFINRTDTSSIRVIVERSSADSMWRPGRELVIITPPKYAPQSPIPVMVGILLVPASPGTVIFPAEGNTYMVKATKPFQPGDEYTFTTQAARFDPRAAGGSVLDNIYVVPNPYVAYSGLEGPGASITQRGEKVLQFRNLPPQCTIRIYTLIGELVDTIVKNDNTSMASWNLLSYEGQRLAYGVYLYHVDVPGVGEKIGRFALIK
ncbi:MAG: hypothetical protein AB1428_10830 [Bacteroidota bacterium]